MIHLSNLINIKWITIGKIFFLFFEEFKCLITLVSNRFYFIAKLIELKRVVKEAKKELKESTY